MRNLFAHTRTARSLVMSLCFFTTAVLCLFSFDGQADASSGPAIISAAEIDYPPFSVVDESGRADGFSVELLREALKAMGREVTFKTGPWNQVKGWLEKGEVQALPLVGRTPEREPLFDFTFPYMSLHGAIVVRKGTTGIRTLEDLKGRQVAVMKDDNAEEFLRRKDRGIHIIARPTFETALQELADGKYDAVFIQRLVALRLIQESGITGLKIIRYPVEAFRQDFSFAVKEGDKETLALLNEGLALVMADGTFRRLHTKWFAAMQLPTDRPVIIGGDHNYPPFEFVNDEGLPDGFMVELTRAIAREMNMNIQIRLDSWSDTVQALEKGDIDVIQGMFYSAKRDLTLDFSPPHLISYYVGVTRNDSGNPPETAADLTGKRLAVQQGDVILEFVAGHNLTAQVSVLETQTEVLQGVSEGRFDCALVPRISALHLIKENNWTNLNLGSHHFFAGEYSYAVKKGRRALLAQFSEGLKTLEQSGEYRRIHDKWLGFYQKEQLPAIRVLRYLAMVAIPLVLVLVMMFLWSRALRRQVARKTKELHDSTEFQRAMIACSPVALYSIDFQGKVTSWNESAQKIFGWTADEVLGQPLPIVPEDKTAEFEKLRRQVIEDGAFSAVEVVRRKKDNTLFDVSLSAAPINDFQGNMIGIMSSVEDITKKKRAQHHIQHLNQVLRAIRDINQLMIHENNQDTLIREGCRLLVAHRGYPSAMIVLTDGRQMPVSWSMAGLAETSEELTGLLRQGKLPLCCQGAKKAKKPLVIHDQKTACSGCPISDSCAERLSVCVPLVHMETDFGFLNVATENTIIEDDEEYSLLSEMGQDFAYALSTLKIGKDQEKLQAQLIQAQKMESVGRLAGGVAHDFNNMLSVIIGYAELGVLKTSPENPLHPDMKEILTAARRSADITKQLLAFARKQTINPRVLDLNETVENMLKMLRRLIGEDINLSWQPGGGVWPVYLDPSQVDQILANLVVNARDAIAGVGSITIETQNTHIDDQYCAMHAGFKPGDFVLLAVSDDGCGMDKEIQKNLFEPFFSTKEKGKGTGLGLATVYGIIKQNNGFINVYSEPGSGTTFKLYLPRHAGSPDPAAVTHSEESPRGQGETILIVEDEAPILTMTRKILENLGYTVFEASSPGKALDVAESCGQKIDLLITDVVMPEMDGRQLATRMQSLYPDIKVLFMSGYTANVIAHRGILDTGVNFIQKPFSNPNLAATIRDIIEGGRS
ncbi:MAG: transporter substrate-binding domain-containing protein [Desulfotignum sp.]|nr:transporter substrate-binding domain-containing protein [Desulfotignum sp.]